MKAMSYDNAKEYYYDILLDMAKQRSRDIFTAIDIAIDDDTVLHDLKDIMIEWYDLRKSIVDELR